MNPESIIEEMGGGLPAVVIVGMGFVAIALWREIRRLNGVRMEDMKDANRAHSDLTKEVARTLDDLAENIRQARRE
ncbi:hypothetical protein [Paracoccus indicus]|uniref:hypothetical protein n=1 Tax=Paracoccus indicus TaxID=2079229 RepID=UPI000D3A8AD4|nr:hypothetical protein [Paracoccus indicus]